jgi:two-component system cell cycle sensor histidine kinase/response regulator CckA
MGPGAIERGGGWRQEALGPALLVLCIVAMELVARFVVRIPNPPALLVLVVVFAAFHGGLRSGLLSAAIAWAYLTWSFSIPGRRFHYSPDDLMRVVIWAVTVPLMALMVGRLKARALAAERAALRESNERFTRAFHGSPIGIVQARLSDGRILDVNGAMLEVLGYSRDEFVGRTSAELGLWPSPVDQAAFTERLRRDRTLRNVDLDLRTRSGETAALVCSVELVKVGDDDCALTFAVDMTERRRAAEALRHTEEQLLQAQKMDAVGRLAGGIAHDFNNLLSVVGNAAAILERTLPASSPSSAFVGDIGSAVQRAALLTRQLLAFSRREPRQTRPFDVGAMVAKLEPFLARTVGDSVALTTTLAPSLGPVLADPSQIDQVLMNLVVNARDAMPNGGRLAIETSEVDLDEAGLAGLGAEARPGRFVVLTVRDTGSGMDQATIARVFEPFFTTKERDRGTGLGLATVYGIVAQSGGFITVESAPGEGAAFKVHLPRMDETARPAERPPSEAQPSGTVH